MRCDKQDCPSNKDTSCMNDNPIYPCAGRTISVLHPGASDASGLMPDGKCSECLARTICVDAMFDDKNCNEFYSKLAKFIDKKIMEVLK